MIYIQMEKDTQTKEDRKYEFVCELVPGTQVESAKKRICTARESPEIEYRRDSSTQTQSKYDSVDAKKDTQKSMKTGELVIADRLLSNDKQFISNYDQWVWEKNWGNWPIVEDHQTDQISDQISDQVNDQSDSDVPVTMMRGLIIPLRERVKAADSFKKIMAKSIGTEHAIPREIRPIMIPNKEITKDLTNDKIHGNEGIDVHEDEIGKNGDSLYFNSKPESAALTANIISSTIPGESDVDKREPHEKSDKPENLSVLASQIDTTQSSTDAVYLEILKGDGPTGNTISGPVQIGDILSLVVRTKTSRIKEDVYPIFMHSCYASDGRGTTKLELIDEHGCSKRPKLIGPVRRAKIGDEVYNYFSLKAFKFPGPSDVYFSCTVEVSNNGFAESCSGMNRNESRFKREVSEESNTLKLYRSLNVELDEPSERLTKSLSFPVASNDDKLKIAGSSHLSNCFCVGYIEFAIIILFYVALFLISLISVLFNFRLAGRLRLAQQQNGSPKRENVLCFFR
ncbi:hypothetical protein AB6A40_009112 [Gnathostoma spinigerum]|uniref:ZP domain-containing protein n=1 Tax=Gnathostoma spinigerum TaxID=75299 RepID=A0ABD6ER27_9BILA